MLLSSLAPASCRNAGAAAGFSAEASGLCSLPGCGRMCSRTCSADQCCQVGFCESDGKLQRLSAVVGDAHAMMRKWDTTCIKVCRESPRLACMVAAASSFAGPVATQANS